MQPLPVQSSTAPNAKRSFLRLRIRGRLYVGFAAIGALFAGAVGYTIIVASATSDSVDLMAHQRSPVAVAITELTGDLAITSSVLRDYLLTGNQEQKALRVEQWHDVEVASAHIDKLSEKFTNPDNKRRWNEVKPLLAEMRKAQDRAEAIAFTPDALPATKLFQTEATERVNTLIEQMTRLMEEELSRRNGFKPLIYLSNEISLSRYPQAYPQIEVSFRHKLPLPTINGRASSVIT